MFRFTWCPVHIGIEDNELADICAKSASLSGILTNNLVSFNEVINSFIKYEKIDSIYIDSVSQGRVHIT